MPARSCAPRRHPRKRPLGTCWPVARPTAGTWPRPLRVRAFTGRPALTPPLFESAIHTTRSLAQAGLGWLVWPQGQPRYGTTVLSLSASGSRGCGSLRGSATFGRFRVCYRSLLPTTSATSVLCARFVSVADSPCRLHGYPASH